MKHRRNRTLAAVLCTAIAAASFSVMPAQTACAVNLLKTGFETTNDSFTGRGGASVQWVSDQLADETPIAYDGICALYVSGRESTWHGAMRDVSSLLAGGNTYDISVAAFQQSGEPVEMKFSLQYSGADGVAYDKIVQETIPSGEWSVLSNPTYTVPAGATDCQIYMETTESLTAFYIDSVTINGSPASIKKGDANGDLSVNLADAVALLKWLCAEDVEIEAGADYNGDGKVNAIDLTLLKQKLLAPPESSSNIDSEYWDNYQETATGNYLKALQGGVLRLGNTYRVREKIAKAQAGEKVSVGYIGGSITEGGSSTSPDKCFVNLSGNYFKDTFGTGNNVSFVNAGQAGTSSVVGNMRVDKDIFSKNCDIIFIEFAVNDQGSDRFQKSYESLVKKCLMQENEPAVIIITMCKGDLSGNEDWMVKIAQNYDLAVISAKGAIQGGSINYNSDFGSGDNLHPGNGGHQIMADVIGYYYRQALKSANASDSYEIPSTQVYGAEYANNHLVDITTLANFNAGSWTRSGDGSFNYSKNGNNPLKFTVEGKGILLLFKSNSSGMGTVNVTVNGKTNKVSSNLQWTWGGQDGDVGYYQANSETLNVEISSADGGTFVLYGVSVIQ